MCESLAKYVKVDSSSSILLFYPVLSHHPVFTSCSLILFTPYILSCFPVSLVYIQSPCFPILSFYYVLFSIQSIYPVLFNLYILSFYPTLLFCPSILSSYFVLLFSILSCTNLSSYSTNFVISSVHYMD